MTIDLNVHINQARALAKAGDYGTSGMIIQLVELVMEKDQQLAALQPPASPPEAVPEPVPVATEP